MFFQKLASSLKPAILATAFALGLDPVLPALAQSEVEGTEIQPTLEASDARGTAAGVWVPATLHAPGSISGLLVDERGNKRFEIAAVTHRIVPSEIPGYEVGSLHGRLLSARLQDDPALELDGGLKGDATGDSPKTPVEPASIYVVGHWSVHQSDGAGRFWGVAYVELAPLPVPLVLLDIGGSFSLAAPVEAQPLDDEAVEAPRADEIPPKFVVCYAGPDLFNTSKRLAERVARLGSVERAQAFGYVQAAAPSAAIIIDAKRAVRFHARWMTRN